MISWFDILIYFP